MHSPDPRHGAVDQGNGNTPRADAGLFEAVFDAASDAILIADDQGQYLAANRAAGELLGPPEQIVGRTVGDFTAPGRHYLRGLFESNIVDITFGTVDRHLVSQRPGCQNGAAAAAPG